MKMRHVITEFVKLYPGAERFSLSPDEWKQIGYLIDITAPFMFFTTIMSTTREPTIGMVFSTYSHLFDKIDHALHILEQKEHNWVSPMYAGLAEAKNRLKKYYSMTFSDVGDIYAFGTILTPAMAQAWDHDQAFMKRSVGRGRNART